VILLSFGVPIVSILVIDRLHIGCLHCQRVRLSPAACVVVMASSSRDARVSSGSGSSARCFFFEKRARTSMSRVLIGETPGKTHD
jgi:hypothetical protein